MPITLPPVAPDRNASPLDFSGQVDAFLTWLTTAVPEFNSLAVGSVVSGTFTAVSADSGSAALPAYTYTGDTDTGIWRVSANTIGVSTGGVERLRVGSTGSLRIVQVTSDAPGVVDLTTYGVAINPSGVTSVSADAVVGLHVNRGTSDGQSVHFRRQGLTVGNISVTTTATTYNTTSDYRLKFAIDAPEFDPAAMVQKLAAAQRWYGWHAEKDRIELGWYAHELAEIVPGAVTGEKDAVDENGAIEAQGRDDTKLIPFLVAALKIAMDRITALEAAS